VPRERKLLLLAALLLPLLTGGAESLGEKPPAADVPDTHKRLRRLYEEHGIWGGPEEKEKSRRMDTGCSGGGTPAQEPGQPVALPSMPAWLGYTILGIIVAGMLIPLIWMFRNSYRDSAAGKKKQQDQQDQEEPDQDGPRPPWRVDLSACRKLLQQGRLAEAFAALHRLTLLGLERLQALTLNETTTNWEYVRTLVGQPRVCEALAAVTLAAEQSVLGQTPPGAARYHELEQLVLARLEEAREAEERL
jgi:hypothetical protein